MAEEEFCVLIGGAHDSYDHFVAIQGPCIHNYCRSKDTVQYAHTQTLSLWNDCFDELSRLVIDTILISDFNANLLQSERRLPAAIEGVSCRHE